MTAESEFGVVHIASFAVVIGERFQRQRCAWCGAIIVDEDWSMMAVSGDVWKPPGAFPPQELILIDGSVKSLVEHEDGAELPANCCTRLDPAVTV